MAINVYSTFPKATALEPHYQMLFIVISRTLVGSRGLTPLQKCDWHILQPDMLIN